MRILIRTFVQWLPMAVAITGICLLVYAAVQQNYRQSLNDPQIQIAEDAAAALAADMPINQILPVGAVGTVDIAKSLTPWLAVYDSKGTPLASSAVLDGKLPQPPKGIFDTSMWQGPIVGHHLVSNRNEDNVSWQPSPDVRQAIVVVQVTSGTRAGYFVVAGRNMREVEDREGALGQTVLLAWLVLIVATFVTQIFSGYVAARTR